MKKLSYKERSELWTRFRKDNEDFNDLCNERDKVARTIEHHQIVNEALIVELKKWDIKADTVFRKEIDKEIKMKNKKKIIKTKN